MELHAEFAKHGWELVKVKFDRGQDRYIAQAKSPHGEKLEAWGPNAKRAASNLLLNVVHHNGMRMASRKVGMWQTLFTDQMPQIAEAYSKAPFYDTKSAVAFMELGRDCVHRAKAISEHLRVELVNDPEPYKSADQMCEDVRKRRKLKISRAGLDHPLWSQQEEISFRTCLDVFGYCAGNSDFGWEGSNQAFAHFAPLVSAEAQKALFTEVIGKTAYAAYYRAYGPAKIVLLPEFIEPAQSKENPHKMYPGLHPTQVIPPVQKPGIKPLAAYEADTRIDPTIPQKLAGEGLGDPNAGWSSGVNPLPINARLDYGDPLQTDITREHARKIDTEWAYLNQEDPAALSRMRQAIVNAFRVVLLSPLKELRFNAVHYQDLMGVDPHESDPTTYWKTLENARQSWNVERFGEDARYQHIPWHNELKQLETLFYQRDPEQGWPSAQKEALDFVLRIRANLEEESLAQEQDKDPKKQRDSYQIELEVNKALKPLLTAYLSEHKPDLDHPQMGFDIDSAKKKRNLQEALELGDTRADKSRYAGFIGIHLKSIAQVSQHIDDILKAALEDVHERDGTGHYFRATVLQLGISGVGPKVASFAWLLLQPMTSQLATIDTHMMQLLGHAAGQAPSPRDYFKMERQLRAGLDASGYHDIPLGQGQWSAWDYKRSGPGQHQDHSPLRVLDPTPHSETDWAEASDPGDGALMPQWWTDTEPIRQQVGDEYDKSIGASVPKSRIPYQQAVFASTKTAATPYFEHPATGEQIVGNPEQTLMQHLRNTLGLSVADIWKQFAHGVGKTASVKRSQQYNYANEDTMMNSPVEGITGLDGGMNSVYQGELTGDGQVVIKPKAGTPVEPWRQSITPGYDNERERAAYLVSRSMNLPGARVPMTVTRHVQFPPGATNEYGDPISHLMSGPSTVQQFIYGEPIDWDYEHTVRPDQLRNLALFDSVIGNHDRHEMNGLMAYDEPNADPEFRPIDHGLALPDKPVHEGWSNSQVVDALHYKGEDHLSPEEHGHLQRLMEHPTLWNELNELGLPPSVVPYMRSRIGHMMEHGRLLSSEGMSQAHGVSGHARWTDDEHAFEQDEAAQREFGILWNQGMREPGELALNLGYDSDVIQEYMQNKALRVDLPNTGLHAQNDWNANEAWAKDRGLSL